MMKRFFAKCSTIKTMLAFLIITVLLPWSTCAVFADEPSGIGMYYIDEHGNRVEAQNVRPLESCIAVEEPSHWMYQPTHTYIPGGWYYTTSTEASMIDHELPLRINGDVHLILVDGTKTRFKKGIEVSENLSLTIYGQSGGTGELICEVEGLYAAAGIGTFSDEESCGSVTINGGKVTAKGGPKAAGIGGGEDRNLAGNVTINGGTVKAVGGRRAAGIGGGYAGSQAGTVTINGGDVTAEGGGGKNEGGGAGIGGGYYSGGGAQGGPVIINGGTVTVKGGRGSAGIGGGEGGKNGPITINAGKVNVSSSMFVDEKASHEMSYSEFAAAIGSGEDENQGGPITINGGEVTAQALWGAGIGASAYHDAGEININGGTVVALSQTGAGIGGGGCKNDMEGGNGGNVTITGGTVYARSYQKGAGIGSGPQKNGGKVTISGGIVTAVGGYLDYDWLTSKGPLLNQLDNPYMKNPEASAMNAVMGIIGTVVYEFVFSGTYGGAGIGGGNKGSGADVTITGGTVTAISQMDGAAPIGHGSGNDDDGNLKIYESACVLDGKDVKGSDAKPVPAAQRESSARTNRYALIGPCLHHGVPVKNINSEQHSMECSWCGFSGGMPHVFDKDTHTCICGHKEYPVKINTEEGVRAEAVSYRTGEKVTYVSSGDPFEIHVYPDSSGEYRTIMATYTKSEGGSPEELPVRTPVQKDGKRIYYFPSMPEAELTVNMIYANETWAALQRAIDKCPYDTELRLSKDLKAEDTDKALTIPKGQFVTIDLMGHTLDRNLLSRGTAKEDGQVLTVLGKLMIKDSGTGGRITGGYSSSSPGAGGIYVAENGQLFFDGGQITRNAAAGEKGGGGVYVSDSSVDFYVSGYVKITDNKVGGKTGNVFLAEDALIRISDTLDERTSIGVTTAGVPYLGAPVVVTRGLGKNGSASNFFSDNEAYTLKVPEQDGDAELQSDQKQKADVNTAPKARTGLFYTGFDQNLVTPGEPWKGTLVYAVGETSPAASEFKAEIPKRKNAGSYTVWYKVIANEGYLDSDPEKITVTIAPRKVTADVRAVNRSYIEGDLSVQVTGHGVWDAEDRETQADAAQESFPDGGGPVDHADVTTDLTGVKAVMADDMPGVAKEVTVTGVTLAGKDAANFVLVQQPDVTVDIAKAVWTKTELQEGANHGAHDEANLNPLIAEGGTVGDLTVSDTENILDGTPQLKDGKLSFAFIGDETAVGKSATATVSVTGADYYEDYTIEITLVVYEKEEQTLQFNDAPLNKTFGDSDYSSAASTDSGGKITYTSSNTRVAQISADGMIHIVGAGTTWITAVADETDTYERTTSSYMLTVDRANVTITAGDQTVRQGEAVVTDIDRVSAEGLLAGHKLAEISVTSGTGDDAGKVLASGAKIVDENGKDVTADYHILYQPGELTVLKAISAKVTFKVVNGFWNNGEGDEAGADRIVTLSGFEGDTLSLTAEQIPSVGTKPESTCKTGAWDVTPEAGTAITEDTTYTYTYAQKESIQQTVTFRVVNGAWDDGLTEDRTVMLTGLEGDILKLTADQIPSVGTKPESTCKAGAWDVTPEAGTAITENTTYTYTYAQKERVYQTVIFRVVNGAWDDGFTADRIVTLTGLEGDTLRLTADQIPEVGAAPYDSCIAGSWDVTPDTETAVSKPTIYTYTYTNITFGTPDLVLPVGLKEIQDSAFENIAATVVEIPDGCMAIGNAAFKNCSALEMIRIPASVTEIGEDAFEGITNVYIFGKAGSAAENYCSAHTNVIFVAE